MSEIPGRRNTRISSDLICPHNGNNPFYKGHHYTESTIAEVHRLLPQLIPIFDQAIHASVSELVNTRADLSQLEFIWKYSLASPFLEEFLKSNPHPSDPLLQSDNAVATYEYLYKVRKAFQDNKPLLSPAENYYSYAWAAIVREFGMFDLLGSTWSETLLQLNFNNKHFIPTTDQISDALHSQSHAFQTRLALPSIDRDPIHPIQITCAGVSLGSATLASLTFNTILSTHNFRPWIALGDKEGNIKNIRSMKIEYNQTIGL